MQNIVSAISANTLCLGGSTAPAGQFFNLRGRNSRWFQIPLPTKTRNISCVSKNGAHQFLITIFCTILITFCPNPLEADSQPCISNITNVYCGQVELKYCYKLSKISIFQNTFLKKRFVECFHLNHCNSACFWFIRTQEGLTDDKFGTFLSAVLW